MPVVETIEVEGHIVDSLLLAKVLDLILDAGADYRIVDVEIGRTTTDPSRARIEVTADDDDAMTRLVEALQVHGANRVDGQRRRAGDRRPRRRAARRLLLDHQPRHRGPDRRPVAAGREPGDGLRARRRRRRRTDGAHRADAPGPGRRPGRGRAAAASGSTPPSEPAGPQRVRVHGLRGVVGEAQGAPRRQVADRMRAAQGAGGKVLAVCGPAVVHTGGAPDDRPAGARRLGRRAVRRQRLRHPRHRVQRARHVARRVGRRRAPGPRAATATTCG